MNKEIENNIKKIKEDEETHIIPSDKGYDFDKENERVKNLEKKKKEKKVEDALSKRDKNIRMTSGLLIGYMVLFSLFTTYSMVGIKKSIVDPNPNQKIEEIEKKDILYTASVKDVVIDVLNVEKATDSFKIDYVLYNKSDKDIDILHDNAYLVDEDDLYYAPGMQFNSMTKSVLKPGEAVTGFMTFFVNKDAENTSATEEKDGYYTVDKDGKTIFVEGTPPDQQEAENKEAVETGIEPVEESKEIDKDMLLVVPFVNTDNIMELFIDMKN